MSWLSALSLTGSAFIGSSASRVLIAVLVALAAGLLVLSIAVLLGRREAKVQRQLAGYDLPDLTAGPDGGAGGGGAGGGIDAPETAAVKQAVAMTSRIAERAGLLTRTEALLEAADVPLRAGEVLFYTPAFAILLFLLLTVIFSPIIGLIGAGILLIAPIAYLNNRVRQRQLRFEKQLPDTLVLLASSLRAGFSLMQGLEAVAQEISDPMQKELQRVFTEVRLGRPVEDALGDAADRMDSNDLRWTVMAIRIQREVGGNLAVLLDTVSDTMVKRERIRRELRALTAEGRLSAIVLSCVSPLLLLAIWLVQPDYLKPLFHDFLGICGLVLAIVLSIVGWFWLRRIVDIEV
jgi:tight adherence protein B